MAFTPNDDLNIIQASDSAAVSAGAGNDTYILSPTTIGAGQEVTITDTDGLNTLQLVGGLSIVSSQVANDALQLTLSNGAVVTLLSASAFNFNVGGNVLAGIAGTDKTYAAFAQEDLGVTVPAAGEPAATGGEVVVGEPVEPPTPDETYTLTATDSAVDEGATASFTLTTENVAEGTEVAYTISGVDAADVDGDLTGIATVDANGEATIEVVLAEDASTEGAETLTVTLDGKDVSAAVTVNDTSLTPAFMLTASADSVNEGGSYEVSIANGDANTEYVLKLTEGGTSEFVAVTTDENGAVSTTVNVSDNLAADSSVEISIVGRTETASVDLIAVNDAPALTGDAAAQGAGTEDTAFTVSAEALLTGYTDEENDALSVANVAADNGATVADNGDGTYTITPAADFSGVVTVSYDVTDGAESVAASWELDFAAVNDAPVAEDATAAVAEAGAAITGQLAASDVDTGDTLTFALDAPVEGLTVNADGSWTFDPSQNTAAQALTYTDADLPIVANYTVTDSEGATDSKSLTITVTPTPLTFELVSNTQFVEEGSEIEYTIVASEAIQDAAITGTVQILPGDGTTSQTSAADFGSGSFNPQTVTIAVGETVSTVATITPTNDAAAELPESYTASATVEGFEIADLAGEVRDPSSVGGLGQTFTLTTGIDTIPGLQGSAGTTGTDGNDTIVATLGAGATLTALDTIDAGLGDNTLRIDDLTGAATIPGSATITNVQTINLRSNADVGAVGGVFDISDIDGVENFNVTLGEDVYVKAADTTAINVSGVQGGNAFGGVKEVFTATFADNGDTDGNTITFDGVTVTLGGTEPSDAAVAAKFVNDYNLDAGANWVAVDNSNGTVTFTAKDAGEVTDVTTADFVVAGGNANEASIVSVTAAAPTTQGVSNGLIQVDGGSTQTIEAQSNDGVTADNAAGAVTVTHSEQGTGNITVNDGTDVTVTATSKTSTGTITVGGTDEATGAVSITQNLNADGTASVDGGDITVTGGTSVDVNVNLTATAKDQTASSAHTFGDVQVNSDSNTTDVTVTQAYSETEFTKAGTAVVKETSVVTFGAMKSGETLIVNGLTFRANQDLSAEDTAKAFAELTAADTQSATGPVVNGTYSGTFNTAVWTSAAASGATVTFTAEDEDETDLAFTGSATTNDSGDRKPSQVKTAGTAEVSPVTSNNTMTYGAVRVDGHATASITTVTVDGYASADLGDTGTDLNALTTLSLANSAGGASVATSATSLDLTVNNVKHAVDLDQTGATVETLNVTATGAASAFNLTSTATTDLTITAEVNLDLGSVSSLTALENATITGAGAVTLEGHTAATLKTLNASDNTGGVTASVNGNATVVSGGDGNDAITILNASTAISKAINLGAGNDTLDISHDASGSAVIATTPTATLDGGADTDTLVMNSAAASAANEAFAAKFTNFEVLEIADKVVLDNGTDTARNVTIDLSVLKYDHVITNGTTDSADVDISGSALILDNMANGGVVELRGTQDETDTTTTSGSGSIKVNVTDAATGDANSLNLITFTGAGLVEAEGVELIDVTGSGSVELKSAVLTTVTVNGNHVTGFDSDGNPTGYAAISVSLHADSTNVELVDASASMGDFSMEADKAGLVVKGGSGEDFLDAVADDVTLYGGAGNDILEMNGGLRVNLHGGEGSDLFQINESKTLDAYTVINDIGSGDTIAMSGASAFSSTKIALSVGADETLLNYANQAIKVLGEDGMGWFQKGGNTYIVMDTDNTDGDAFVAGTDQIVMLVGLVDLGTASYNSTSNTLEIA